MTENTQATLLRRMTRLQDVEVTESPLTSSRAVRLALTKAANDTIGLIITVQSVAEEEATLDDMLGTLDTDLMLMRLTRAGAPVGIVCLDMQLRAAIVEMQTVGALIGQTAPDRAPTNTDAVMSEALMQDFLAAFPQAVKGTAFEGWGDGVAYGARYSSAREAGLILDDCRYRIVTMRIDLGVAEREGTLMIILPLIEAAAPVKPAKPSPVDWHGAFQATIAEAPTSLSAILHEFELPLATIDNLVIGQALHLPGCTVDGLRLIAGDGTEVAQAKLGQVGGMRAVRLQVKSMPHMSELTASAADAVDGLLPKPAIEMDKDPKTATADTVLSDEPTAVAETDLMPEAEAT